MCRQSGDLPNAWAFVGGGLRLLASVVRIWITKHLSGFLTCESPVDLRPFLMGCARPTLGFPLQDLQIRNPPLAQALSRVQAELDLSLVEPASVFGRVVNGEPIPKISAFLLTEVIDQRLAAVDIEVIHDDVNGLGEGILLYQMPHHASEFGTGSVRRRGSEVPSGLRFYNAKYIRRAASFILIVLLGRLTRCGWRRGAHIRVQRHRFFIQANDGLGRIVGFLVHG